MTALLQAEFRKFTTNRSALTIAVLAAAYGGLAVLAAVLQTRGHDPQFDRATLLQIVRSTADLALPSAVILGVLATAGEYRHGTIVPTLLAVPRRGALVVAKVASQAALGVAIGATGATVSVVAGMSWLRAEGFDTLPTIGDLLLTALGVTIAVTVYGALGAALGLAVKDQTIAITGALVWMMAVEEIVPIVLRKPGLRQWMPDGATDRLLHLADPSPAMTSGWAAVLILTAFTGVLVTAAAFTTTRSDLH